MSDDSDDPPALSERQAHVVSLFPAETSEIAEEVGISMSTVRDHIQAIRGKGVSIKQDDGTWHLVDEQEVRRTSTKHKGTKTREANRFATEMEATILRRLSPQPPLVDTQDPHPENEDVVAHLTDIHMGDVVESESGREVYNPQIAADAVRTFTDKTIELCGRMSQLVDVDTLHLLWGGDMLTNENIYDGQAFDIRLMLAEQMSEIVEALVEQVVVLCDEFDSVQLVSVPGNHGKTRASGVSRQANMDLIAYRWVEDRIHERNIDNINVLRAEASDYRNFELRGGEWRGHLRHGHNCQIHADATARSESDWRGWREQHQFDIAYRGHYHTSRIEDLLNCYPVVMSPSPKPGDEFASRIGSPDVSSFRDLGTLHGVSDERPMTWSYVLNEPV